MAEIGIKKHSGHWLRGGFPRSFLGKNLKDSMEWRKNFIKTLLERDLPQFGISLEPVTFLRLLKMLAHYHGQIGNASELGRSLGISESVVRRYLDIFEGIFIIRQLQPWFENLKKRQVKTPKIYFRDSGIVHYLLGIGNMDDLFSNPKSGASWEGYVLEEIFKSTEPDEMYFWATHNGAELDLLILKNGKRFGFEIKRADAPKITPSMKIAMEDLKLKQLFVIYSGDKEYSLSERITVLPVAGILGLQIS